MTKDTLIWGRAIGSVLTLVATICALVLGYLWLWIVATVLVVPTLALARMVQQLPPDGR
jgi:hypothetical protein